MKNRLDMNVTYNRKIIFRYFIAPSKEGIIFGVKDKSLGDIHVTIFFKNGELRSHITDKTNIKQYHWRTPIKPEILGKKIDRRVKKWIRQYHGNKIAYIMTDYLKKKLLKEIEKISSSDNIPYELSRTYIVTDFNNPKRWKRVKIKELLVIKEIGYYLDRNIVKRVYPVNNKQMICYSEKQFENLLDMLFSEIGLYDYIEYIKDKGFSPKI